jgi:hypothetical protein
MHESLVSTILLVFASTAIYDEVYPKIIPWCGWQSFVTSIERGSLMNPFPCYFFIIISFIWFAGFLFKRMKDDDAQKRDDAWREGDTRWKAEIS